MSTKETTTMPTVDQLETAATQARQRHEAAELAADQARQRAEADRAERLAEHDRRLLAAYDDDALAGEVRDAQRALDQALTADPLGGAWVQLKVAQLRRAHLAGEAVDAANRLGEHRTITPRPAAGALFEELGRAVDRVAESVMADELDARDEARAAAGEGG